MIHSIHIGMQRCIALAIALTAGCQTYTAKPLDLSQHRDAFLSRTLQAPDLTQFSAQLAAPPTSAQSSFDLTDGVSLAEAECVALVFNAELRRERLQAGATLATAETAGLWTDPVLGVDFTKLLDASSSAWEAFGNIAFTLPLSGRLELETARASTEHQAQLTRVAAHEWETRVALRQLWTERAATALEFNATREFLAQLELVIGIVDAMETAGELSRTQARLFRVERAVQRNALLLRESRVARSNLALRALMGLPPNAVLACMDAPLSASLSDAERLAIGSAIESRLDATSLRLRAAGMDYTAAEQSLEAEVRAQYPDLVIGPGFGKQDGDQQFLLGLSAPLGIFNGNRAGIARATAAREIARAAAETLLEDLVHALADARASHTSAALRRTSLETDMIPLVDAQRADTRRVAEQGEVDTLLLLESLKTQQNAKILLIEALRDEVLAELRLIEVAGEVATEIALPINTTQETDS